MEHTNPVERKPVPTLSDKAIFTEIWIHPRRVFRFLDYHEYDKFLWPLLMLTGISRALSNAVSGNMGDDLPRLAGLGIVIVLGGLLGWLGIYIYASLIQLTGSWLGGKGITNDVLRALAYASIPVVVSMAPTLILLIICGSELFTSNIGAAQPGGFSIAATLSIRLPQAILGTWSFVLSIAGIAEVQQFSVGKAIANALLPLLIFLPFIVLIVLASV